MVNQILKRRTSIADLPGQIAVLAWSLFSKLSYPLAILNMLPVPLQMLKRFENESDQLRSQFSSQFFQHSLCFFMRLDPSFPLCNDISLLLSIHTSEATKGTSCHCLTLHFHNVTAYDKLFEGL